YESAMPVCYITEDDAIRLFGNTDVIGMPIEVSVGGVIMEYTVVGITSYSSNASMMSFAYEDMPIYLNVPLTSLTEPLGLRMDQTSQVILLLSEDADSKKTCDEVLNLLNARHGTYGSEAFTFMSFSDILSIVSTVINVITLFISLVAAISLLVGGIGVMNIMLVSVTERTREIGIRKALGAKTGSITLQFLSESAIITLIGGILGILLGVGGAFLITGIVGAVQPNYAFTPSINAGVIIGTTIFSSAVGIFFGIYPARKAAKMNPIDALRSL
ncbi:MAG: FtsX-like permease family protein, partial [Lachnospiraceae bacterium]|nr:FtsX-like permease family protein [Lachnospiraceae bacterium]